MLKTEDVIKEDVPACAHSKYMNARVTGLQNKYVVPVGVFEK